MTPQAHDRALRAAIRLALGTLVLTGCAAASDKSETETESSDLTAKSEKSTAKLDKSAKADAGGSEVCPDAKPEPKSCDAILAASFPDGGGADWWKGATRNDPELVRCCTEIAGDQTDTDFEDQASLDDFFARENRIRSSGCCDVQFPGAGAACTPWGPPVPPAMPWAFLAEVA